MASPRFSLACSSISSVTWRYQKIAFRYVRTNEHSEKCTFDKPSIQEGGKCVWRTLFSRRNINPANGQMTVTILSQYHVIYSLQAIRRPSHGQHGRPVRSHLRCRFLKKFVRIFDPSYKLKYIRYWLLDFITWENYAHCQNAENRHESVHVYGLHVMYGGHTLEQLIATSTLWQYSLGLHRPSHRQMHHVQSFG